VGVFRVGPLETLPLFSAICRASEVYAGKLYSAAGEGIAVAPYLYNPFPECKKPGFFNRGRLGAALGSTFFETAGLAAVFAFAPAVFPAFAFAVDATALGFRGMIVNSSSFPQ
jgi:hypothetical protein